MIAVAAQLAAIGESLTSGRVESAGSGSGGARALYARSEGALRARSVCALRAERGLYVRRERALCSLCFMCGESALYARSLALQTGIIEGRSRSRRSVCALRAERGRFMCGESALCARADTCRRELPPRFRRGGCDDYLLAWAATSRR